MIYGGKVNLNEKEVKNLYLLHNNSNSKRRTSPILSNNTTSYNYINNNLKNNLYENYNNFKKRNTQFPLYKSFLNPNNYYHPISQKNNSRENKNNYKYNPILQKNNQKDIFIQRVKDLINQREKKTGKQIINEYYTQNLIEMMKKNVDNNPNGINLSISNCETQYPINEDDFFRKFKIFLDNYENVKGNNINNNNGGNIKASYDYYSKILNKKNERKNKNNSKIKFINESVGENPKTFRPEESNYNNYNENYSKEKNLNSSIPKIYKEYNKTTDNFHIKKDNETNYKYYKNKEEEFNQTERNYKTLMNINDSGKNYNSRIKLMNIENKQNDKKIFKKCKKNKMIKIKNELMGKNINKEYELQEQFITKIKLFIEYLESYYILSLTNFFHYFITQLHLYNLEQIKKNKNSIQLLKRFQKARKVNKDINKSFNINNNNIFNSINSFYSLNKNNIIENYKYKNNINLANSKKVNISPDVYIPKNKIGQIRLSRNKNKINNNFNFSNTKNTELSLNISNNKNTGYTENNNNLSTGFNSKKLFTSNKKKHLMKSRNEFSLNINSYLTNNKTENKNTMTHIKNISSFDVDIKNNLNEIIYSKKKPTIYLKPRNTMPNMSNMKKIIPNNKDINNENNSNLNNINLYTKVFKNNSVVINNQLYNNKNNYYNTEIINSILIKNVNKVRSPIKPKSPSSIRNYKNIYKKKNNEKKSNINVTEEIVIKDICSYDKKLWVTIKYITSEELNQNYYKMKIRKRLLNINDNKNIFLNNDLRSLKKSNIESIELIPPITKINTHIEKLSNKICTIPEEKEDLNISNKIIDMIKIIEKYKKQNILYLYKYFFDILKKAYNLNLISLSHKKIFKNIKNSFNKRNDIDISKISNKIIESNENENDYSQDNNSDKENITIKNNNHKKEYWKRNLYQEINIPKLKIEDNNSYNTDEVFNNLNKSEFNEKTEFSHYLTFRERNLNFSDIYDIPKKAPFRLKINKYKIFRDKIPKKKMNLKIKDIIKEDEEMRKKNKIIFLLTNKFNHYNNCLRIIRYYFKLWKLYKYNDEDDESNIENLNNSKEVIKFNDLIDNKNFSLSLNTLSNIKNQKRIEINSIIDSEDNKSIHLDKNELEEKIEYFRYYIINYYAFKRKNNGYSEEEKEA